MSDEVSDQSILDHEVIWEQFYKGENMVGCAAGEKPAYAVSVTKMRITLSAVRHLLITTHSIYNFEPDSYRKFNRKINLSDLTGIIVSISSEQILLQVYRSHDFHLVANTNNSRTNLVENICVAYSALGFDPKQTPPLRGERYLPVTAEKVGDLSPMSIPIERIALKASLDQRLWLKRRSILNQLQYSDLPMKNQRGESFSFSDDLDGRADMMNLNESLAFKEKVLRFEGSEVRVLFSKVVGKINNRSNYQRRVLVLTHNFLYTFTDESFSRDPQRAIAIAKIDGLVVTAKTRECVIQVSLYHDLHLDFGMHGVRERDGFCRALMDRYVTLNHHRLVPQHSLTEEHLIGHVCQETDLQLKIAVEKQSIQLLEIAQGKRLPFARSARRRKNIVNPLAALMPTGTDTGGSSEQNENIIDHRMLWNSSIYNAKPELRVVFDEKPVFGAVVKKTNRHGLSQPRNIVLTTHAIYNFNPTDSVFQQNAPAAKRRILYTELSCIFLSVSSCDILLECRTEYDYVFTPSTTQLRNLMLKFIQEYYPRRRMEMYELVQKIEDAKAHAEGREAEQMVMECDVFGKRIPIVPLEEPRLKTCACEKDEAALLLKRSFNSRYTHMRASIMSAIEAGGDVPAASQNGEWRLNGDHINLSTNRVMHDFLHRVEGGNGHDILFSDDIWKVNDMGLRQRRVFVVTNTAIYNFLDAEDDHLKKPQRVMLLKNLEGIVRSRFSSAMVLQFTGEQDYYLEFMMASHVHQFTLLLQDQFLRLMKRCLDPEWDPNPDSNLRPHVCPDSMVQRKMAARRKSDVLLKMELLHQQHKIYLQWKALNRNMKSRSAATRGDPEVFTKLAQRRETLFQGARVHARDGDDALELLEKHHMPHQMTDPNQDDKDRQDDVEKYLNALEAEDELESDDEIAEDDEQGFVPAMKLTSSTLENLQKDAAEEERLNRARTLTGGRVAPPPGRAATTDQKAALAAKQKQQQQLEDRPFRTKPKKPVFKPEYQDVDHLDKIRTVLPSFRTPSSSAAAAADDDIDSHDQVEVKEVPRSATASIVPATPLAYLFADTSAPPLSAALLKQMQPVEPIVPLVAPKKTAIRLHSMAVTKQPSAKQALAAARVSNSAQPTPR